MASPQHVLAQARQDQFQLAGCGLFAQVIWVVGTEIALKKYDEIGAASIVEKQIYDRLGSHPSILRCYGEGETIAGNGLALQYLPAGTLGDNLALSRFPVERKQWPYQAIEAVRYIQSKGVIHCDIGVHNFLVQSDGSIVLSDFCGSVLDNSKPDVAPGTRYSRPTPQNQQFWKPVKQDDIFALGTVLYELSVGHRLFAEKSDYEIRQLIRAGEFPDTSSLASSLRTVIDKCWRDQYDTLEEAKSDLGFAPLTRNWNGSSLFGYFGLSLIAILIAIKLKRSSISR